MQNQYFDNINSIEEIQDRLSKIAENVNRDDFMMICAMIPPPYTMVYMANITMVYNGKIKSKDVEKVGNLWR